MTTHPGPKDICFLFILGELTSNNTLRQKFTHSVQDLRDPQGSDQLASIKVRTINLSYLGTQEKNKKLLWFMESL